MDIHKPKPWHGVREFLKEYVIIVVGVLTALAAEQGVEWLHWRLKVEDGRAAIHSELAGIAFNGELRFALMDCWERRISFLQDQLEAAHGVWAPMPWRPLQDSGGLSDGEPYAPYIRTWNTEVWRSLVADGTAVHFPRDETLAYARIYQFADVLGALNQDEVQKLSAVAPLGRTLKLSDQARYETARGLQDAKRNNRLMGHGSAQLLGMIGRAHMMPSGAEWNEQMARNKARSAACLAHATEGR